MWESEFEMEPLKFTVHREYRARLRAGEEAKIIVRDLAKRLDTSVGSIAELIWAAEFESGEFYCRINGIDTLQFAEMEQ